VYRLSNLFVTGMVSSKPTGMANKTVPNCASFKLSWCLIVGMRDAHVEYPKPEIK
jgi:hypothetical protein